MKYTYNAVKFKDKASFNKNKTKRNVIEYHDEMGIIVFEDTMAVAPNIKKVSHVNRVYNLNEIPTEKVVLKAHDISDGLMYLQQNNIKVLDHYPITHTIIIELPEHTDYNIFWKKLNDAGLFGSISHDTITATQVHMATDYTYNQHWHLIAVRAQEAWDNIPAGNPINYVAVIDLGCQTTHPDLVGRTNFNWNTYVSPPTQDVEPSNQYANHGTSCAGLICANPNNGIDTIGIGGDYTLVQFLNPALAVPCGGGICLSGSDAQYVAAYNKIIENPNACVISMSYGGSGQSSAILNAITDCRTLGRGGKGIVCCASMGNDYSFNLPKYPASYPGVLGIGATTVQGVRSAYSNYGANIFAAAPGSSTPSSDRTGADGYTATDTTLFNGTSAACPVYAACVGLGFAANPNLTEQQMVQILKDANNKIGPYDYNSNGPGSSYELGYGQIDAAALVALVQGGDIPPPGPVQPDLQVLVTTPTTAIAGDTINVSITVRSNVVLRDNPITFDNDIYYSTDQILDPGDTFVTRIPLTIAQNNYYVQTNYQFTIPQGISGDLYITVYADAEDVVNPEGEVDNVGFSKVFVLGPPTPPAGLNLAVEILDVAFNAEGDLIASCLFENRGFDEITSFSISKGFVGKQFYTHTLNRTIESEKIFLYDFKINNIPPYAEWSTSPYKVEILTVNGVADDVLTDNAYEMYINQGGVGPQP